MVHRVQTLLNGQVGQMPDSKFSHVSGLNLNDDLYLQPLGQHGQQK